MSIWVSETTGLESKRQLQHHRRHRWQGLLLTHGLVVEQQAWWTDDEKALEHELWVQADADYEERKTALRAQLARLSPQLLATYFAEIGVPQPADIDDYIGPRRPRTAKS